MEMLAVTIHPDQIIEHVANKLDQSLSDHGVDQFEHDGPSPLELAVVAINALADFNLLDGKYFAVVQAARAKLGIPTNEPA